MIGVGYVGLIGDSFFVGVRRVQYEFCDGTVSSEMEFIVEKLHG